MPFFDQNPVTLPRIAARLRRALAQNRAAARPVRIATVSDPETVGRAVDRQHPRTTLDATIRPVGSGTYRRLGWAPGEAHVVRDDLGLAPGAGRAERRRSLLYFSQHTDIHITDAQAPARLVGAQAFSWIHPGSDAAHRPQETMTTQVFDQLVRATNRLVASPLSGAPMAFCAQTGDHTDNRTVAEFDWWATVIAGGTVTPNTGVADRYEGVQRSGVASVWNPDLCGVDRPQRLGFPFLPGVLDAAIAPFVAEGLAVPVVSVFGNHDRIFIGTFGLGKGLRIDLIEPLLRNGGHLPANAAALVMAITRATLLHALGRPSSAPARIDKASRHVGRSRWGALAVTPDPTARRRVGDAEYAAHFPEHDVHTTWWSRPEGDGVQVIGVDTSNHTGSETGRIGPRQRAWLEAELAAHHRRVLDEHGAWVNTGGADRLIVIVSHHNSWVMENHHDDEFDPGEGLDGEAFIALLARHPNVVLWLNGHSHEHRIAGHRGAHATGRDGVGFWEVCTTSVVGFAQQGRLFELFDNGDETISILSTVFDHDAAPAVSYPTRTQDWTASQLASLSRELAANDNRWLDPMAMLGRREDRNVELVVRAPFAVSAT